MSKKIIKILQAKLDQISALKTESLESPVFQQWMRDTSIAIEKILGYSRKKEFDDICFYPQQSYTDEQFTDADNQKSYIEGLNSAQVLLNSMIKECGDWPMSHDPIKSGAILNINNSTVSFGNGAQHAGRDIKNVSPESEKKKSWCKKLRVIIVGVVSFLAILTTVIINCDKITEKHFPKEISKTSISDKDRITQLRPRIKKRVDELYDKIDNEKLKPWVFINAGVPVKVTKHDGSVISYEGGGFTGSPRVVFWSDDFMPPFIEDAIVKAFDQTIEECRANGIDPKPHLFETNLVLSDFIYRIYNRMASIDSKLTSEGTSEKVQHKKDVTDEINRMRQSLERHYGAALLLASNDEPDRQQSPNG